LNVVREYLHEKMGLRNMEHWRRNRPLKVYDLTGCGITSLLKGKPL